VTRDNAIELFKDLIDLGVGASVQGKLHVGQPEHFTVTVHEHVLFEPMVSQVLALARRHDLNPVIDQDGIRFSSAKAPRR
jgi:hypothetical protein